MDRDIPSFNRAVMDRIYAKNHELHLKRLKNIKSSISSNKPYLKPQTTYLANSNSNIGVNYHTKLPQYNNLKKEVATETKNAQIERQNAILFQKMIKIMKRPDKNNDPALNKQRTSVNITKQRMSMQFSKINQQNRALFHRLQSQRPTIDNKKLEEQRVKNLNILKFLGKYPNYEAISKSHNKSFDMKSRRMNSTTNNRGFYNSSNDDDGHYEVVGYQDDGSNLIEFHNQLTEHNRDLRRLKMQQHFESRIADNSKMSATMTGFHHNKKLKQATQSNTNNSRIANQQLAKIQIYEPVVPNRRRYLSQNQRRSQFNSQTVIGNQLNHQQHETSMDHQTESDFKAYHLNHPSHNIIIEDHNAYNKCKKWNVKGNNITRGKNQTDGTGETNFNKPKRAGVIQHQRKLNTKNSQQNILINNQQQLNVQNIINAQGGLIVSDFDVGNNQPVPIPRFAQPKGKIYSKNMVQNNEDNILQQGDEQQQKQRNNKNVIILYKGVVGLRGLLLQQQKSELLSDIYEQMNQQGVSDDEIIQIPMRLLDWVLQQLAAQITIQRLFDSYKISIEMNANVQISNKITKETQQQQQSIEKQFDKHFIQWLRNIILQRLQEVAAVEIPEVEGSMLLEGMDYDYKGFIGTMVRVEKDCCDEQFVGYRVAIVLEQMDKDVQSNNQLHLNFNQQEQNTHPNDEVNKSINNHDEKVEPNSQQQDNNQQPKQQQPGNQNSQQQQQQLQQDTPSQQQQSEHESQQQQQVEDKNKQEENHNYVEALDEQLP